VKTPAPVAAPAKTEAPKVLAEKPHHEVKKEKVLKKKEHKKSHKTDEAFDDMDSDE